MLTASVSFGVQNALIAIGGYWVISLLLTLALLAQLLWPRLRGTPAPQLLLRALALLLLIRFAVPLAAVGSDSAFRWFLAERYESSQTALSLSATEVDKLAEPEQPAPTTLSERAQRLWSDATASLDVGKRIDALKEAATRVTEHVVELIVVFLLQTLIVPSLLLWGLWRAALELTRRP
jgi:hypothetical protein